MRKRKQSSEPMRRTSRHLTLILPEKERREHRSLLFPISLLEYILRQLLQLPHLLRRPPDPHLPLLPPASPRTPLHHLFQRLYLLFVGLQNPRNPPTQRMRKHLLRQLPRRHLHYHRLLLRNTPKKPGRILTPPHPPVSHPTSARNLT